WREFVGPELADTDQIAQTFGLFGLGQLEKRIEAVYLAFCGRLAILRERFQLSSYEFSERAVFKSFDNGTRPQIRHEEHTTARDHAPGFVDFAQQRGLFDGRQAQ